MQKWRGLRLILLISCCHFCTRRLLLASPAALLPGQHEPPAARWARPLTPAAANPPAGWPLQHQPTSPARTATRLTFPATAAGLPHLRRQRLHAPLIPSHTRSPTTWPSLTLLNLKLPPPASPPPLPPPYL